MSSGSSIAPPILSLHSQRTAIVYLMQLKNNNKQNQLQKKKKKKKSFFQQDLKMPKNSLFFWTMSNKNSESQMKILNAK